MADTDTDISTLWPRLARQAGIAKEGYALDTTWPHRAARRFCQLERYCSPDGPALIVKVVTHPKDSAGFAARIDLQARAAMALSGAHRMPQVLARDDAAQAVLMAFAAGERLYHCLESSDDHLPWLTQAGAWLAAYHRVGLADARAFQPAHNLRRLKSLVADIEAGRPVCAKAEFLALARRTAAVLPSFAGQTTQAAAQHGDMNFHNLLVGEDALWGLDITNATVAPVGYDIARLLIHYATNFADLDRLAPGEAVPKEAASAFFDGYDLVGPRDPSVQTLLRVRILNDWMRVPPDLDALPIAQQIRFHRAKLILENLLDQ